MTKLSDIERAYETKYSHELEEDFKAIMRRNKLLGLWAAEKLGMSGAEADAYALQVIEADFEKSGHEDVVAKVLGDLVKKGVDVSDHIVRKTMDDLLVTAKEQLAGK